MISLGILIPIGLLLLLLDSWVVARTARAVGSPRGRFGVSLLVILLTDGVIIAMLVLFNVLIKQATPALTMFIAISMLVIEVGVVFGGIKSGFKLGFGRTFAPFGVYAGLAVIQFALAVYVVRPFITEAFVIPTGSMSPTLNAGDSFLVSKLIHPRRLDLVAYRTNDVKPTIFCKRLIGLPGERLRFEGGGIFINDKPITLPAVLAGKCRASAPGAHGRYQDGQTIMLGADEYFFIGDNIEKSYDSRFTGPTAGSSLVGVVDAVYWPPSKMRILR